MCGSALRMWQIGAPNNSGWMEATQQATLPAHESAHYLPNFPTSPSSQRYRFNFLCVCGFFFFFTFWVEVTQILVLQEIPCTPGSWAEGERMPLLLLNLNICIHNVVIGASDWERKTWVQLSAPHFLKFLANRPQLQCETNLSSCFFSAISLSFLSAWSILHPHYVPYMEGEECCWQWIFIPLWGKASEDASSYFWENASTDAHDVKAETCTFTLVPSSKKPRLLLCLVLILMLSICIKCLLWTSGWVPWVPL